MALGMNGLSALTLPPMRGAKSTPAGRTTGPMENMTPPVNVPRGNPQYMGLMSLLQSNAGMFRNNGVGNMGQPQGAMFPNFLQSLMGSRPAQTPGAGSVMPRPRTSGGRGTVSY